MTESTLQRFRSAQLGLLPLLIAFGILAAPASSEAQVGFVEHVISNNAGGASWVVAADFDGDGDTDVLSAALAADTIAWYENDGASPPSFTEWIISTSANGATSVFAADVDGDGDTDALSSSAFDDTIAWYENDGGSPPGFTERIISTTADQAQAVFAADVDGDGDTDALSASEIDDTIAWYENDGASPPSFSERVISTSADGAFSVFAVDVDGDGDTDVLSAWGLGDTIAWHENDGASPPGFAEHVISTSVDRPRDVFAADVDGDGDADVLSASENNDKIAWYENDGASPPGFTERVISTSADGATSVFTADIDGDGDTDVLSASWLDDTIAWYESDGASPPGFTERVISTAADGATCALAADVDGDGEIDVVSASHLDHKIAWYEHLGSSVSASVTGLRLRRVSCSNLTTGVNSRKFVSGVTSWSCDDFDLQMTSGDRVLVGGRGTADGTGVLGGTVAGMTPSVLRRVTCLNLSTAQTVQFTTAADSWDCEAEGLIVAVGHVVKQTVRGEVQ